MARFTMFGPSKRDRSDQRRARHTGRYEGIMNPIRTTLITGGNSGIGEALARKLVDRDQRVVSVGLEKPAWTHEMLTSYRADLTSIEETRAIGQKICQDHAIDCLVHNAGVILPNLLP